jgi:uncharacterized membrane protein YoaK (UPF0700 family)
MNYFRTHYDEILHWLMAGYAGFEGLYSVILHGRNFANAQTGNLMSLVEDFLLGDMVNVMARVGALIMFVAGVVISFLLSKKTSKDMRKIVIAVNAVTLTAVALMPLDWHLIITIYPMIFAASFQWGTFSEAQGYASSTIFLSNNTKQSALAWTQFFMTKDWKFFHKAILYTFTIVSFLTGCYVAGCSVIAYGAGGAYIGYTILAIALILVCLSDRYGGKQAVQKMDRIAEVEAEERMPK